MVVRPLGLALLVTCFTACATRDDAARPASIDSAIAAFQAESVAAARPAATTSTRSAPLIALGDTLIARQRYRCTPALQVMATYWRGATEFVRITVGDSTVVLPLARSASGARYHLDAPETEWWNKGDSARFTRRSQVYQCGSDSTVQF